MASFTDLFFQFWNPKKMMFWIMFLILGLIIIAIFVYRNDFFRVTKNKKLGDIPNSSDRHSDVTILFFFAEWCPHCKNAKPAWEDFKSSYHNKTTNGVFIVCKEYDCSDNENLSSEVKNAQTKYNVQGYPTIKMLKDGQVIDFDAKITAYSLKKFVEDMV